MQAVVQIVMYSVCVCACSGGWGWGKGGGRIDVPAVTAAVDEGVQAVVEEAVTPRHTRDDVPTPVVFAATHVQRLVVAQIVDVLRYVTITAPGSSPHITHFISPPSQQPVGQLVHPFTSQSVHRSVNPVTQSPNQSVSIVMCP